MTTDKKTESTPPLNLAQRLLVMTRTIGNVDKTGKAAEAVGGYDYMKADDVASAVRNASLGAGVLILWTIASQKTESITFKSARGDRQQFVTEVEIDIKFINADDPEDTLTMRTLGHGVDPSDKAPGKAVTYALKTAYIGLFHLKGQIDNEAGSDIGNAEAPKPADGTEALVDDFETKLELSGSESEIKEIGRSIAASVVDFGLSDDQTNYLRGVMRKRLEAVAA